VTLSKTSIILYDIENVNNFKKISNFTLVGKENIVGIVPNLSTCFNKFSYFIYTRKCSKIYILDLKKLIIMGLIIDMYKFFFYYN